MWDSFDKIISDSNRKSNNPGGYSSSGITSQDIKIFMDDFFTENFGKLTPPYEIDLRKKNIFVKINPTNPLILSEIINKKDKLKKYIEEKTKTKFNFLEIK